MGTRVHKQGSEVRGPLFKLQFTGLMGLNKTLEFVAIFVSSHATQAQKEPLTSVMPTEESENTIYLVDN